MSSSLRGRLWCIAAALSLLGAQASANPTLAASSLGADGGNPIGVPPAAIQARAALGFSTDASAIAGLTVDDIDEFGAALTAQEDAFLRARVNLQLGLAAARSSAAAAEDEVAGVSLDADGTVVVTTTSATGPSTSAVVAALPTGIPTKIIVVPLSLAGLENLQTRLEADAQRLRGQGVAVIATALDPRNDQVVVTVNSPIDTSALTGAYGPNVRVQVGTVEAASCSGCKTFTPIRGGLEILSYHGYDSGWEQCTSGFNARPSGTSGTRYLLSAGHCFTSTTTTTFVHNGNSIGTASADSLNVISCCIFSDSLRITRNSYGAGTPWNSLYLEFPPHPPSTAYLITSQVNHGSMGIGDTVCTMGVTSQGRCGTITALNGTMNMQPGGRWGSTIYSVHGMVTTNFPSARGDSGGPVYSANRAYGLVSAIDGSSTWFSAIDLVISDLGGLRLCFDSGCS